MSLISSKSVGATPGPAIIFLRRTAMYWKAEECIDENNEKWLIYNYLEIVDIPTASKPYYNGIIKKWTYPQSKQLIIKAVMSDSEEAFLSWYEEHKKL